MAAVGGDDSVLLAEFGGHAAADRLLARVEVQKAADVFGAVQLRGHGLHAANGHHLAEELVCIIRRQLQLVFGALFQFEELEVIGL